MIRRHINMKSSILALTVIAVAAACTPTLQVVSYAPGIIAPRGRTEMNVVQGGGKAGARDVVARLALQQLRGGWFRPVNRTDEAVRFALVGHHAEFSPQKDPPGGDGLWVRFDVVNWQADDVVFKDEQTDGTIVEKPGRHLVVGLQVSVVDEEGHVLVDERPYAEDEVVEKNPLVSEEAALSGLAQAVVGAFVDDVTPDRHMASVRLDDSDSGQKYVVGAADDGKIPVAIKLSRKYVKKYPQNAVGHYNLGALLEAQGRFDEALVEYDKALDIQPRDYYPAARLACAQRRSAWLAIYGDEKEHKPTDKTAASPSASASSSADAGHGTTEGAPPAP